MKDEKEVEKKKRRRERKEEESALTSSNVPNIVGHGLGKLSSGHLQDDEALSGNDHNAHERVATNGLDGRVRHVDVELTEARKGEEEPESQTDKVERAFRRHPEEVLEEEGVELFKVNRNNEEVDTEEALERSGFVPAHLHPRLGSELRDDAADLVSVCGLLVHTLPVVLLDLEVLAELVADVDTEAVADEDVEDPLVPPALLEVGQHVGKVDLDDLPGDGDEPANHGVADNKRLEHPVAACRMPCNAMRCDGMGCGGMGVLEKVGRERERNKGGRGGERGRGEGDICECTWSTHKRHFFFLNHNSYYSRIARDYVPANKVSNDKDIKDVGADIGPSEFTMLSIAALLQRNTELRVEIGHHVTSASLVLQVRKGRRDRKIKGGEEEEE